ncbi:MAG: hypothetical protein PSV16_12755 [Flavobacterium sp.]|nr:hypothetical protein [Flavobacterium sp.]
MKKIYLCLMASAMLLSCSNDSEKTNAPQTYEKINNSMLERKTGNFPENQANDYDLAGQLYYDISEAYLPYENPAFSTAAIIGKVKTLANANPEFLAIKTAAYKSPSATQIDDFRNNPVAAMATVIATSSLGTQAKASVADFIITLMWFKDQQKDYNTVYNYTIAYEAAVIGNSGLNTRESEILLTTASVARYAFYFADTHRRKPRDRDWDISIGHIVAALDGAGTGMATAVTESVAFGIADNR